MLNQIFSNPWSLVKLVEMFLLFIVTSTIFGYVIVKQQAKTTIEKVDVPIVVAGKFRIKPEKREEFIELSSSALEPTLSEAGVISYGFYEDSNLKNNFLFFEEWKSREALKLHLEASYLEKLLQKFPEFINGEPNIRVYEINKVDYELPSTTN